MKTTEQQLAERTIPRTWSEKTSRQIVEDAIDASKLRNQTWWQVTKLRKEPSDANE